MTEKKATPEEELTTLRERLAKAEAVIEVCQRAHRAGNQGGPCLYATKDPDLRPLALAAFDALRGWK